jgi:hypothetical protein
MFLWILTCGGCTLSRPKLILFQNYADFFYAVMPYRWLPTKWCKLARCELCVEFRVKQIRMYQKIHIFALNPSKVYSCLYYYYYCATQICCTRVKIWCRTYSKYCYYYKPEGRGFDSRWGDWIFSIFLILQPYYGPGVDSASNRNEYRESSPGCKGWPARKADNLTAICEPMSRENVGASTSHNPMGLQGLLQE